MKSQFTPETQWEKKPSPKSGQDIGFCYCRLTLYRRTAACFFQLWSLATKEGLEHSRSKFRGPKPQWKFPIQITVYISQFPSRWISQFSGVFQITHKAWSTVDQKVCKPQGPPLWKFCQTQSAHKRICKYSLRRELSRQMAWFLEKPHSVTNLEEKHGQSYKPKAVSLAY